MDLAIGGGMNGTHFPPERVRENTSEAVLRMIDLRTIENVRHCSAQSRNAMERRLRDLNKEWDVERLLETNASSLALGGLILGSVLHRKWFWLSGGVLSFLLMHGVQGWCPPLPVLRRLGVRTRREIDRERTALKVLMGDFEDLTKATRDRETGQGLSFDEARQLVEAC
jgi:hypothetical protein